MTYKNLFSCLNKIAVVTGGAGFLGKPIVKALHEFGAKVYLADINSRAADEVINKTGIDYIYLDIASKDSVKEAMTGVIENDGRIDILVNCAYPRTEDWGTKFEYISYDSWKKNVNSHLGGHFVCCQIVAEQMKKQSGGSIINFASIYGVVAPDFSIYEGTDMTMPAAYSAIKGGIITFTKYLASYYANYNVRANVISPGGIFSNEPQQFVEQYSQKTPLGRMGTLNEIVGAAVYLASNASSYVTGHNLIVDGGWTAL